MFDVHAFLERLVQLLRHQELWVPLAIVLPMVAWAGFKAGRYFPYFDARVKELETKLKESLEREAKCDKIHKAVLDDESELWRSRQPSSPSWIWTLCGLQCIAAYSVQQSVIRLSGSWAWTSVPRTRGW